MIYIKCPQEFNKTFESISLFLAGGITNCPNWQNEMSDLLKNTKLTLIDPRRDNWDVNDSAIEQQQINWEFKHLNLADAIMFWFPCETLCPITLYELGFWNAKANKKIFVGCHPEYKRKSDVVIQTQLVNPNLNVVSSLNELKIQILDWINKEENRRMDKWRM